MGHNVNTNNSKIETPAIDITKPSTPELVGPINKDKAFPAYQEGDMSLLITDYGNYDVSYIEQYGDEEIALHESGADESPSFFSLVLEILFGDEKEKAKADFSAKIDSMLETANDFVDMIKEKVDPTYYGNYSTIMLKKEAAAQIESQTAALDKSFVENDLKKLNEDLKSLGYTGEEITSIEQAKAVLEELVEERDNLMSFSIINRIGDQALDQQLEENYANGAQEAPKELTDDLELEADNYQDEAEKLQNQINKLNEVLGAYEYQQEQIEFTLTYAEYEKKIASDTSEEFMEYMQGIDDVTFCEELKAYGQEQYQNYVKVAGAEAKSYEEWIKGNEENIYYGYLDKKYMEWKIATYYSKENLRNEQALEFFDKSEVSTYNYIYTTVGEEAAEDYLEFMKEELNRRQGEKEAKEFLEELDGSNSDYLKTAGEGFGDGIEDYFTGIANWVIGDENLDVNDYKTMYILQAVQDNPKYKPFLDGVYSVAKTTGNMAVPVAVSFVSKTGGKVLSKFTASEKILSAATAINKLSQLSIGVSAGGNAYDQALEEGNDTVESLMFGAAVGSSELLLEKFLGGIPGISETNKGIVLSLASEYGEEYSQTFIETGLKCLLLKDEFKNIEMTELMKEANEAGIMGVFSAGIINGTTITIDSITYTVTDMNFIMSQDNPGAYFKSLLNAEVKGQSLEEILKATDPPMYEKYMAYKNNSVTIDTETVETLDVVENTPAEVPSDVEVENAKEEVKPNNIVENVGGPTDNNVDSKTSLNEAEKIYKDENLTIFEKIEQLRKCYIDNNYQNHFHDTNALNYIQRILDENPDYVHLMKIPSIQFLSSSDFFNFDRGRLAFEINGEIISWDEAERILDNGSISSVVNSLKKTKSSVLIDGLINSDNKVEYFENLSFIDQTNLLNHLNIENNLPFVLSLITNGNVTINQFSIDQINKIIDVATSNNYKYFLEKVFDGISEYDIAYVNDSSFVNKWFEKNNKTGKLYKLLPELKAEIYKKLSSENKELARKFNIFGTDIYKFVDFNELSNNELLYVLEDSKFLEDNKDLLVSKIGSLSEEQIKYLNENLEARAKKLLIENYNIEQLSYTKNDERVFQCIDFIENELPDLFEKTIGTKWKHKWSNNLLERIWFQSPTRFHYADGSKVAGYNSDKGSFISLEYKDIDTTASHEIIHDIARMSLLQTGFETEYKYRGINESVTEYINKLLYKDSIPKEQLAIKTASGYDLSVKRIDTMVNLGIIDKQELIDAYMSNDISFWENLTNNENEFDILTENFNKLSKRKGGAIEIDKFIFKKLLQKKIGGK